MAVGLQSISMGFFATLGKRRNGSVWMRCYRPLDWERLRNPTVHIRRTLDRLLFRRLFSLMAR